MIETSSWIGSGPAFGSANSHDSQSNCSPLAAHQSPDVPDGVHVYSSSSGIAGIVFVHEERREVVIEGGCPRGSQAGANVLGRLAARLFERCPVVDTGGPGFDEQEVPARLRVVERIERQCRST